MTNLSEETRKRIVYRINGGTTVVQASAITNVEELVFAFNFLAHHRLYKVSKLEGEVTALNAEAVSLAFNIADAEFGEDVLEQLEDAVEPAKPISELGQGRVANPYNYV